MSAGLKCARCGAPVPLPNDFGVWLARCQYCGFDQELPDRAARQAFDKQRRDEVERAAREQAKQAASASAAQARKRVTGAMIAIFVAVPLVLTAVIGGIVAYATSRATSSLGQVVSTEAPPPAFSALANQATAGGCPKVLDGPSLENREYSGSFTIVKRECMRFVALAKTPAPLSFQITDAAGKVTTQTAPTGSLDASYCTPEDQNHLVKITGAQEFWVEAFTCPRAFGTDANSTGMAAVSARLKQLMSHGCYEISLAATTVSDSRKLTTPLEPGTCFDVLAATGVSDNALSAKLTTPFGESVEPMPAPSTQLEVPYCATTSGPHVVELTPAVDGPFSMAIAICNRAALPKSLPKATK